ncbi:hypothetical protein Cob_v000197 [Colletotrichum orbiculare MAFF 240422]|uniref:Uncharacterized protein n=1 Tax=Colletotrichum orbiculare (strain 104-T / ATCC 96160 / CBS 514.97 / LARS 414 / MAFF 240422) TaxID=1213857 RepID=A0A484GA31_COLOR|nr:hypothetical protein Cob_v000197 [Colletotrichum orbiculare MAFF 240422]
MILFGECRPPTPPPTSSTYLSLSQGTFRPADPTCVIPGKGIVVLKTSLPSAPALVVQLCRTDCISRPSHLQTSLQ